MPTERFTLAGSCVTLGSMSPAAPKLSLTYAEFIAGEVDSLVKHDFVKGQVFAMAGSTPEHAALTAAIGILLGMQLRGKPYRVYSPDLRVRIQAADVGTYPDLSVVCGELVRSTEDENSAVNPTLIVEVLSERTEAYDRGDKFSYYRLLPSFKTYVLVSQRKIAVERHLRNADGSWTMTAFGPGDRVVLDSIGCELAVDEVYEGVVLQ
jgi:Uma2 family endonuclease